MDLVFCPSCNNECSPLATSCPKCGHPFAQHPQIKRDSTFQRSSSTSKPTNWWKIGVLFLSAGLVGLVIYAIATRTELLKASPPTSSQKVASNAPVQSTPEQLATLDLEVGIDYRVGGVQPVTSENFYLLDSDLEQILKNSGLKPMSKSYLQAYGFGLMFWADKPENVKAANAIREHAKYSTQTDLKGKARFSNVRPETYYVFGFAKTRGGYAIWNKQIAIKSGANSQILDSKNAAQAF